jgi:Flp pilus assembly protein TadG
MRERLRSERGSVLALTAVLLAAMLGMAALAVDVAGWYQMRRQLQSAADAAALAAAQDLPTSATATNTATGYVTSNITGATSAITTPYNGDSSQIKVTVTKSYPSVFGSVLGLGSVTITASAVAQHIGNSTPAAVFAMNTSCTSDGSVGVYVGSNNNQIVGGTHSNGFIYVNSNNNALGPTSYAGPSGCGYTLTGAHDTFGGAAAPTKDATVEDWPASYVPPCTSTRNSFVGSNLVIPAGVYCASSITLNGNGLIGQGVTFEAASFTLVGNNWQMNAATGNPLLYYSGTGTLGIYGNNLNGQTIFAPNGTIQILGNNGIFSGFVEGKNVQILGNNNVFTGDGPPTPGLGGAHTVLTQ